MLSSTASAENIVSFLIHLVTLFLLSIYLLDIIVCLAVTATAFTNEHQGINECEEDRDTFDTSLSSKHA